ncbi:MAG: FG-GAP repeat protein, partial [Planctomycetota bacterium]
MNLFSALLFWLPASGVQKEFTGRSPRATRLGEMLAPRYGPAAARGWLAVAAMALWAFASALAKDDRVPEGLSASDWSSIRAVHEANCHAAYAVEGGYQVRNPGQQWRTRFDGRGFVTTPDAGSWSWGLELVGYGRGCAPRSVATPSCVEVGPLLPPGEGRGEGRAGQRVSYQWDDTLTEWYVNDGRGLEHGYTVHQRPGGFTGETPMLPTGGTPVPHTPLQFTLAVRGDLHPRISDDGHNVTFVNDSGAAVVNYHGLTVLDANGRILPAWFTKGRNLKSADSCQPELSLFAIRNSSFITIVVNDAGAAYPLTIDPIAQQAYLKASNTEAGDYFGHSVAVSGDTVVVGAPLEDSNATGVDGDQADNSAGDSGAAYVFVRSGGVWSQQAYLKASNTGDGDEFGISVALSGDTLVAGATAEDSNATGVNGDQADNSAPRSGAAYVFVRSGGVWSQQAYLKASNTGATDEFGFSVAVSGDTAVVGASFEDSNATGVNGDQADNSAADSGAAYVFVRSGGVWSQQAYLKASNTGATD